MRSYQGTRKEMHSLPNQANNEKKLLEKQRKTAAEIYLALGPLIKKTRSARLRFLAYLLAMAAEHAKDVVARKVNNRSGPSGSGTSQPC